MLDHVSIGVRDFKRAVAFYDATLTTLGYKHCKETTSGIGYGHDRPAFWVMDISRRPQPAAQPGFGLHFGFQAANRAAVRAFHAAAIAAGGRDNGSPGLRPEYEPNFYGAFVLDPEGYKIEAVCRRPE